MSLTTQSASEPVVEANRRAVTSPAIVTSDASGSVCHERDVVAALDEALVLDEPRRAISSRPGSRWPESGAWRYGTGAPVRDVGVERVLRLAAGASKDSLPSRRCRARAARCATRRPRVPAAPAVGPGLEGQRLRQSRPALALEVRRKNGPGRPGGSASPSRCRTDVAELVAGPPTSPRGSTARRRGGSCCRVVLLERRIDRERTVEVLLVPPAATLSVGTRTSRRYGIIVCRFQKSS
jgi:hypothetical protein